MLALKNARLTQVDTKFSGEHAGILIIAICRGYHWENRVKLQ